MPARRPPQLTEADLIAAEAEYCARSLSNFTRRAWPIFDPTSPYVHGWHIDAICEHLEAITHGELTHLLINIPPGCMKSSLVNVLWPAWEWGPAGLPIHRYIGASHEIGLATRDTRAMRRVVQSDWYQTHWGVEMAPDQNQKTYFENAAAGFRQAATAVGMTGKRGHRVMWDDPISAENANRVTALDTVIREFRETMPSRLLDPLTSANVVVMQRLHQRDVSGYILANELDYEHLCLPMEFEKKRRCVTKIGFEDPRKEEGELLFPERFPASVVERDKRTMTEYAVAGQFQQRPAPRGGGTFPVDRFKFLDDTPPKHEVSAAVRYWDKAGTEGGGDWTAGVLMYLMKDGRYVVADVRRFQAEALDRRKRMRATAEMDGQWVVIWSEQEGGSGGKESAEQTIRDLAGFNVHTETVTGSKQVRAEAVYAPQQQGGNVYLVRGEWNTTFVDEHETFPNGMNDDQVDAASGACAKLAAMHTYDYGALTS